MARPRAGGFILVVVLAVLVVLTLLASAVALSVERARDEQAAANLAWQDAIDRQSTEATVMYLLATQRMTYGGLTVDNLKRMPDGELVPMVAIDEIDSYFPLGNEIRLDGTPYRGFGRIRFALQDDRGRFSINFGPRDALLQWLQQRVDGRGEAADLLARLLDYQDSDDLVRLNGAEAADYRAAGLPPPSNRTLVSPLELRRVLGWREALAGLDDPTLLEVFTVSRSSLVNVNTASEERLAMVTGWDREVARRLLSAREQRPLSNALEIRMAAGLPPLDDEQLLLFPGNEGTLTLWSEGGGTRVHRLWQLTPNDGMGDGARRPWRTQYELILPAPAPDGPRARTPEATVFTDPAPADP